VILVHVTSHSPHLTRLSRLGSVNCFFVHEEDGLTLIDTGLPGSATGILRAAAAVGRPIRRILLTHAHWDHAGSVDRLLERIPEAELMLTSREGRLLAGDMTLDPAEPGVPVKGRYLHRFVKYPAAGERFCKLVVGLSERRQLRKPV